MKPTVHLRWLVVSPASVDREEKTKLQQLWIPEEEAAQDIKTLETRGEWRDISKVTA